MEPVFEWQVALVDYMSTNGYTAIELKDDIVFVDTNDLKEYCDGNKDISLKAVRFYPIGISDNNSGNIVKNTCDENYTIRFSDNRPNKFITEKAMELLNYYDKEGLIGIPIPKVSDNLLNELNKFNWR